MKLGAAIPVLNEWRFLPAVAGQLLTVVDRLVLMRPSTSQSGAPVEWTPLPPLDPRIEVLEGNWTGEAETRNAGMRFLSDCDYIFMVDSDEILLDEDLRTLASLCRTERHPVIAVKLFTYWKTPDYVIDPPEDGAIKMVLRQDQRMTGIREVNAETHTSDVSCHHLSYVRTDDEVREKLRLSGHSHEMRTDWYEQVWKAWDDNPGLENLHPVHPSAYRRAIRASDGRVKEILEKWGCR